MARMEFEKEFDNRYEGLDYDGVEFSVSPSAGSLSGGENPEGEEACVSEKKSTRKEVEEEEEEETMTRKRREPLPVTGGYLVRCHGKLLQCLLGRMAQDTGVSMKSRYTACRLAALMCVYIGEASSKQVGASRGGACMSLAKKCRIQGDRCLDECANALGVPSYDGVLNIDEVSRVREMTDEVGLLVGLFRMSLATVSVQLLKKNKDVTLWLKGLKKQSRMPHVAEAARATWDTWKIAVQCASS